MDLNYILWMYLIIDIIILLILTQSGEDFTKSIFIAILIGFLFLLFAKPPNDLDMENDNISSISIYFAIILISFIIIMLYSILTSVGSLKIMKKS